jgi:murein DD-endopeptidase MepM/ murein hydrolase activator NlpD
MTAQRVNATWLDALIEPFYKEGYDVVGLHMSNYQRKKWGLLKNLGGSNPKTASVFGQFYLWADEDSERYGEDRFTQNILHEFLHEFFQKTGLPDTTHAVDSKTRDVAPLYKTINYKKYPTRGISLVDQVSILTRIANELRRLLPLNRLVRAHPRFDFDYHVSQAYGVKNSAYKLSGRHIGTDWACPVGTPIYACFDGEVIKTGFTKAQGNYAYLKYEYKGNTYVDRCLHLDKKPVTRKVKRGDIFAVTGNTGFSTGAHSHVDTWVDEIRIGDVNKTNWNVLTKDPDFIYG